MDQSILPLISRELIQWMSKAGPFDHIVNKTKDRGGVEEEKEEALDKESDTEQIVFEQDSNNSSQVEQQDKDEHTNFNNNQFLFLHPQVHLLLPFHYKHPLVTSISNLNSIQYNHLWLLQPCLIYLAIKYPIYVPICLLSLRLLVSVTVTLILFLCVVKWMVSMTLIFLVYYQMPNVILYSRTTIPMMMELVLSC